VAVTTVHRSRKHERIAELAHRSEKHKWIVKLTTTRIFQLQRQLPANRRRRKRLLSVKRRRTSVYQYNQGVIEPPSKGSIVGGA
jgi:uncharacterized protein HemY